MNASRRIGITMGDPAGVGPEIILKALREIADRDGPDGFAPVVYGAPSVLADASASLDIPIDIHSGAEMAPWPAVSVIEAGSPARSIPVGKVDDEAGRLAVAAIQRAVSDALAGDISAIVTAPISKEAINLAGHAYSGHTEMLADLTGSHGTCMMLVHENMRVSHVSTHVALSKVPSLVTPERLTRVLDLTIEALGRFGFDRPRVAVAALNPHAGEGGLFGNEESEVITPVIESFRAKGHDIRGPISGDTVFVHALGNEFDAVVAMYHDQGHIPLKLLGFRIDPVARKWTALSGVNITLGLPFIRTSVDHGTAFDIAGKGVASAQSMVEAIDFALNMAS